MGFTGLHLVASPVFDLLWTGCCGYDEKGIQHEDQEVTSWIFVDSASLLAPLWEVHEAGMRILTSKAEVKVLF